MSTQLLLTPGESGGHIVEGSGDLPEFRALIVVVYLRAEISLPPAARRRHKLTRRSADEASSDKKRKHESDDGNDGNQCSPMQGRTVDLGHHRRFIESDGHEQACSATSGGNEADD